jgi:hypothetical protein
VGEAALERAAGDLEAPEIAGAIETYVEQL